jgi:hypothetical protein
MTANDEQIWQLHLRWARGETLAVEEQAQLDAWYARQDHAELAALHVHATQDTLAEVQAQIDELLTKLAITTNALKQLGAENATLRQENAALRRQVLQQAKFQPA